MSDSIETRYPDGETPRRRALRELSRMAATHRKFGDVEVAAELERIFDLAAKPEGT